MKKAYLPTGRISICCRTFVLLATCVFTFPGAVSFATDGFPAPVAADNLELRRLIEIENQVNEVVTRNMAACVAVSDGIGMGSGVIVSESGLVLTAGHVMATDRQYDIILPSGRTVAAKPLGKNLDVDSGMLQIMEKGPWPFVEVAENRTYRRGEWVVSLGHSGGWELGRKPPVRTGRILGRDNHQIVTDAVLIGGDSGGPLFDLDAKLIAIHSSIGDSVAENRHVTIDTFHRDWDRLERGESWGALPELNEPGSRKRPGKIGVTVDREAPNCRIKAVKPGSPADEAGIRENDVVTRFDGIAVRDGSHLIEIIKQKSRDEVYSMSILRNGNTFRFEIQLR